MKLDFECPCGSTATGLTEGEDGNIRAECEECGATYAVTITPLTE